MRNFTARVGASFLYLAAAISPALAADDPAPPPAPVPAAGPNSGAANGPDMTLADFQARFRERMMAADTDHDGRISAAEFIAAREARMGGQGSGGQEGGGQNGGPSYGGHHHGGGHEGHHGGGRDPGQMFDRLDVNGDGYIDAAELDAISARRFARMDANGDGVVTADERQAARGSWHQGGGDHEGSRDGN